MQPKGAINFSKHRDSQTNKNNEARKKELLKKVFDLDQPKTPAEEQTNQPKTSNQQITEAEAEAQKDILKDSIKAEEKSSKKLDDLAKIAEIVLYRTKATNPIDFFPDEIIVDMNKVSIIHNQFFLTAQIHSVMITNVTDIFIETGFFWSKLIIVDKGFVENTVNVEYLNKEDALRLRRIIQGLVVAQHQEIDFTKLQQELSVEEIIEKLETLGKARVGD